MASTKPALSHYQLRQKGIGTPTSVVANNGLWPKCDTTIAFGRSRQGTGEEESGSMSHTERDYGPVVEREHGISRIVNLVATLFPKTAVLIHSHDGSVYCAFRIRLPRFSPCCHAGTSFSLAFGDPRLG